MSGREVGRTSNLLIVAVWEGAMLGLVVGQARDGVCGTCGIEVEVGAVCSGWVGGIEGRGMREVKVFDSALEESVRKPAADLPLPASCPSSSRYFLPFIGS